jgi:putative tryptophan/tyrosine transport system substrate-binding protein
MMWAEEAKKAGPSVAVPTSRYSRKTSTTQVWRATTAKSGSQVADTTINLPINPWRTEVRRREFIAGLAAVATWSRAARAQHPAMPVIGYLSFGTPTEGVESVAAFLQGLAVAGYVEGRDVAIEFRWANRQGSRLPSLAEELVQRQVAMIVALDGGPSALAAQAATSTIPILFLLGADPAKFGFVAGGNMTGLTSVSSEIMGKRVDLLREIAPAATTIGYITDPRAQDFEEATRSMLAAVHALGRQAIILEARSGSDIDAAFVTLVGSGAGALVVGSHVLFERNSKKVTDLAARHRISAIYPDRGFVVAGGLMSYTTDGIAAIRQIGRLYAAQILKGAKPADLLVRQPTKFNLVINLSTAKVLGLTVPEPLLASADELVH